MAIKYCYVCKSEFGADVVTCPADGVLLSAPDPLLGTVFDGRYEIIELAGQGGFGVVYKARQQQLDRIVALKILKSIATSDPDNVRRFSREAKAASELSHPNIARVYSFGVSDGGDAYLVMEFLNGRRLAEMLAQSAPLTLKRALAIMTQICEGVAHAHARDIIHRDIKPANIMLARGSDGQEIAKVLDFGSAKFLAQHDTKLQQMTQPGQLIGTIDYMSPEQAVGGSVDCRSDVFSLGKVFCEMIACDQKIPLEARAVVERALAPDPSKRYDDAGQMLDDLRNMQAIALATPGSTSTLVDLPVARKPGSLQKKLVFAMLGVITLLIPIAFLILLRASADPEGVTVVVPMDDRESTRLCSNPLSVREVTAGVDSMAKRRANGADRLAEDPAFKRLDSRVWLGFSRCVSAKDWTQALQYCDELLRLRRLAFSENSIPVMQARATRVDVLREQHRFADSRSACESFLRDVKDVPAGVPVGFYEPAIESMRLRLLLLDMLERHPVDVVFQSFSSLLGKYSKQSNLFPETRVTLLQLFGDYLSSDDRKNNFDRTRKLCLLAINSKNPDLRLVGLIMDHCRLRSLDKPKEALAREKDILAGLELVQQNEYDTRLALRSLALCKLNLNMLDAAESELLACRKRDLAEPPNVRLQSCIGLMELYRKKGDGPKSLQYGDEAMDLLSRNPGLRVAPWVRENYDKAVALARRESAKSDNVKGVLKEPIDVGR